MPYGDEAKEELTKLVQGKCLRILVYEEDQYGRSVGDIYCNGTFVQVPMELCSNIPTVFFFFFNEYLISMLKMLTFTFLSMVNQEVLLKKGCAWHYAHYDKRPQLARVCTNMDYP